MRNGFEERFAKTLPEGIQYEPIKMPYRLECNYQPDFVDVANKVIWETKGFFRAADRRKIRAIKDQYPDWRLIMVLQDPGKKITKKSKTTYALWCEKNGIEWMAFK